MPVVPSAVRDRENRDAEIGPSHSNYAAYRNRRLVVGSTVPALLATATEYVHHQFRSLVLARAFSCLGAKSALRRGNYGFGLYPELGSREATAGLGVDLRTFLRERAAMQPYFHTFVACFAGTPPAGEDAFEARLWEQLQRLHGSDAAPWDPTVSADPAHPQFSFSFGGTAMFVVGLHPASSRLARRFAWPTLVFNPHDQFVRLREAGKFRRLRDAIRRRERALQGSLNPNVEDHGAASEARQYSGRPAEPAWRCPFQPHGS